MANQFDLKKFLNENKLTRASKAVNEAAGGMVKLFDFPDLDSPDHEQYERLGFTVRVDDEANNVAYAEMITNPDEPTSSEDWMSIMQVLEDAQSFGLAPHMEYMGKIYSTKEAYQLADNKASTTLSEGDSFDYSNLVLSTINSLTDMGEEGQNALRVLEKISDWNELVRLATEE
jgi:hypothetical protein